MTLDDKLNQWREATESLAPSEALLGALAATIDAPGAAATATATGTGAAVKVLLVSLVVGLVGAAVIVASRPGHGPSGAPAAASPREGAAISGAQATPPPLDAGPAAHVLPSLATPDAGCAPRAGVEAVMPVMAVIDEQSLRARAAELTRQLSARPLTCEAQRAPIDQLVSGPLGREASRRPLVARLLALCGPADDVAIRLALPLGEPDGPCDDSDWCHDPTCRPLDEACAQQWAARPRTSCAARHGRQLLLMHACARFLRGEATVADVRARSATAWCVSPEVLEERARLLANPQPNVRITP